MVLDCLSTGYNCVTFTVPMEWKRLECYTSISCSNSCHVIYIKQTQDRTVCSAVERWNSPEYVASFWSHLGQPATFRIVYLFINLRWPRAIVWLSTVICLEELISQIRRYANFTNEQPARDCLCLCLYSLTTTIVAVRLSLFRSVISGSAWLGLEAKPWEMLLSLRREIYWSRIRWKCELFKRWSFLQSKSVNNVCKLLRLLWDFVPRPPTGASPLGRLPSHRYPGL